MRQGPLTIQQDGTLTIAQGVPGDAIAVEAAVATFVVLHQSLPGMGFLVFPRRAGGWILRSWKQHCCRACGRVAGGDHTVEPAD